MDTPSDIAGTPRHRTVVSFVNRGGRVTVGQARAWDRLWPTLGRDVTSLPPGALDVDGWFGRPAPVILEIGPGMGETTAALAQADPSVNHLAVDVYQAGLAQLMMRAEAMGIDNLRLLRGDAVVLLERNVPPGSLAGVRIFYPDPWPKKKHHKRRLVRPGFMALVASRLEPGARVHLATDWADYAEQMLAVCEAEPLLRNVHASWAPRPRWRPRTKFESRAEEEGRVSRDLIFERV
ncbi:tRNA (guanosine(46)-N7)-methyltransferase TrmB [Actinophytocola sp.]|uniref:tRNA (guanosine(46)-N7)-methyltransferase TrmB n=1 Tax=Actinophytocola sp. TaxID=1872138 RepID=UPI003D6ABBD9